jgi:hypothetical protein
LLARHAALPALHTQKRREVGFGLIPTMAKNKTIVVLADCYHNLIG